MSFKSRIEQLIDEQAERRANQMIAQRMQQVQQSNSNFGEVIKTNGTDLTIELQDGTITTATAAGNRFLGSGDCGVFNAGLFQ